MRQGNLAGMDRGEGLPGVQGGADRIKHRSGTVSEKCRTVAADIVDVAVAVGVPQVRSFATLDGERNGNGVIAEVARYAPGQHRACFPETLNRGVVSAHVGLLAIRRARQPPTTTGGKRAAPGPLGAVCLQQAR